ncbi:uncharacterized protein LOC130700964 [Daphnia carinata]|uniref:uncharacterized protein LOC130700964 n=1 Tax=Daphnia carinata TaxID=120202 RepID=UPI00257F857A|nr:uncharacterized protein LOC130700964 [Daphnia carinata]XP_059353409.1 uncharacterized protein LOC130700964 [Daphnia carinata]
MSKSDQPKIGRTGRAKGLRRWDKIENRMLNRWHKMFKDQFKHFPDEWMLTVTEECPQSNEWGNSLQERLSMACKCKDCGHIWVTDTGVVYFYYSLVNYVDSENEGKVIVWVKQELCPNKESCGSIKMPLIDVYQDEVEAVVSYLKMQIGWLFYECQYTENDETSIENRRKFRGGRLKKGEKSKALRNNVSVIPETVTLEGNVASCGHSPPVKPDIHLKPRNLKPNQLPEKQPIETNRYTKLKTRWDKTPKQIQTEWELSFHGKFDRFTNKNPSDKWIMSLEKVTKDHPLRREKKWEHFLGEKVEAGFRCPKCGYVWESKRGWVSFWIWQNPPNSEGIRIGEVAVHVLGQKCLKCPGTTNGKEYYTGDLQPEEIDVVLDYLYMEIDYYYYNNCSYTHQDEEVIENRRMKAPVNYFGRAEHKKTLCQPCQQKVCKKKVYGAYPGPVVPPPGHVL